MAGGRRPPLRSTALRDRSQEGVGDGTEERHVGAALEAGSAVVLVERVRVDARESADEFLALGVREISVFEVFDGRRLRGIVVTFLAVDAGVHIGFGGELETVALPHAPRFRRGTELSRQDLAVPFDVRNALHGDGALGHRSSSIGIDGEPVVHGVGVSEVCARVTNTRCASSLRLQQTAPHGPDVVGVLIARHIGKNNSGGRVDVIVLFRGPPAERVGVAACASSLEGEYRDDCHDG